MVRRFVLSALLVSVTVLVLTQASDAYAAVNPGVKTDTGAAWAFEGTPTKLDTSNMGAGISCGSSNSCVAVGGLTSISGPEIPFAESWNGQTWSRGPSAIWAGQLGADNSATSATYTGVSCTSPTSCEAVGWSSYPLGAGSEPASTLAASWNGSEWNTQQTPNVSPLGDGDNDLTSVSCVISTYCTAVGWSISPNSSQTTMVQVWNGTDWALETTSVLKKSLFDGVSCVSTSECIAVGSYRGRALAESWNGTTWTVQSTPHPAGATSSSLSSVSCSANGSCSAVGSFSSASGTGSFAESWNGSTWVLQHIPEPAGADSTALSSVACAGSSSCFAVGDYELGATSLPLSEERNGAVWSIEPTSSPSDVTSSSLSGVACTSTSLCQAVGTDAGIDGTSNIIAEKWGGQGWSSASIHDGGFRTENLSGISCTSAAACQGVGEFTGNNLAEGWSGSAWSLEAQPLSWIDGHVQVPSSLFAVSCPAATMCMAAGTSWEVVGENELNGPFAAVEMWNGSAWTKQLIFEVGSLTGVSCPTAVACTAVGSSAELGGAMIEGWNGTSWTLQSRGVPQGGKDTNLAAVSCTASTACTAVGSYVDRAGTTEALVETWNGTTWAVQPTPTLEGATATTLDGVSCTSPSSCTAVGSYTDAGHSEALIESWNGKAWRAQPTPLPGGTSASNLSGISCTSSMACTAVGSYTNREGASQALLEGWNGSSWSIESTPFFASASLDGVSCWAGSTMPSCAAVGTYTDLDGIQQTLALSTSTAAPYVKRQPWNQAVNEGGTATFTSVASGNPAPQVEWQVSKDGGNTWSRLADGAQPDGSVVSHARTEELTISNVQPDENGYEYEALFSNSVASSSSVAVTLDVD